MGSAAGGSTQGATSQAQAPQQTMSTVDFAKQFAPMATSLADFQRTNHYTPQDYIQAYVSNGQPTKSHQSTIAQPVIKTTSPFSNSAFGGQSPLGNIFGLLDLKNNNKLGGY